MRSLVAGDTTPGCPLRTLLAGWKLTPARAATCLMDAYTWSAPLVRRTFALGAWLDPAPVTKRASRGTTGLVRRSLRARPSPRPGGVRTCVGPPRRKGVGRGGPAARGEAQPFSRPPRPGRARPRLRVAAAGRSPGPRRSARRGPVAAPAPTP